MKRELGTPYSVGELKQLLNAVDDDHAYLSALIMRNGRPYTTCIVAKLTLSPSAPGAPGMLTFEVVEGQA